MQLATIINAPHLPSSEHLHHPHTQHNQHPVACPLPRLSHFGVRLGGPLFSATTLSKQQRRDLTLFNTDA